MPHTGKLYVTFMADGRLVFLLCNQDKGDFDSLPLASLPFPVETGEQLFGISFGIKGH
jgi:hypothetical protein